MVKRRDFLKAGLAAGGASFLPALGCGPAPAPGPAPVTDANMLQYMCPPDGSPPPFAKPSPPSTPFAMDLRINPVKKPIDRLDPPPDPSAHQLYDQHGPKVFYEIRETEHQTVYHTDPPYNQGTWNWGYDGITPGPTYHAKYGEPVMVRRHNNLPTVLTSKAKFALPSTSSHLHNGHTASESDGNPTDWIDSGEFWDHHYCNFPSHNDPKEKLTTLWYHDHRMDFTAANVYAGLAGFYLLFDEQDSNNENDPNPNAFRLPSGKYDVSMILHDVLFDQNGQVVFDSFNTDGILGDKYTVNRCIQPRLRVERRKYRFRIVNGGPSRFLQLRLKGPAQVEPMTVLTGDGNFLPQPVDANAVYLSPAQRSDIVIDFAKYKTGDFVYLQNVLEQTNGRGPSGRIIEPAINDSVMRFDVIDATGPDPSRIPDRLRELPTLDRTLVRRQRTWGFDYVGGLWTVNGKVYEPNRVDAKIERGSAEIWTMRNQGKNWSHPIHSHFTEFLLMEVNGIPVDNQYTIEGARTQRRNVFKDMAPGQREKVDVFMGGQRRDVATLLPDDEVKVYMQWSDFLGKHVMHCHNVVHEDHAMMIRWDIVKPGKGFDKPQPASKVYREIPPPPHLEERPSSPTIQDDQG